eukprot:TRINITY_DN5225_c0_g1_i7.p1 TRINITY_DN5225_c0_g1~~TRINITY_DN5225_c0_g1_i7.p1  ORF type:complete len:522 (-),score=80.22 TRINITY_DN5225_c0_g1_i7:103-1668(-)
MCIRDRYMGYKNTVLEMKILEFLLSTILVSAVACHSLKLGTITVDQISSTVAESPNSIFYLETPEQAFDEEIWAIVSNSSSYHASRKNITLNYFKVVVTPEDEPYLKYKYLLVGGSNHFIVYFKRNRLSFNDILTNENIDNFFSFGFSDRPLDVEEAGWHTFIKLKQYRLLLVRSSISSHDTSLLEKFAKTAQSQSIFVKATIRQKVFSPDEIQLEEGLYVISPENEFHRYQGSLADIEEIAHFIEYHARPLITTLSHDTAHLLAGPITRFALLFIDRDADMTTYLSDFKAAAKRNKDEDLYSDRLIFMFVANYPENEEIFEIFGVNSTPSSLPTPVLATINRGELLKFKMEETTKIDRESINAFVSDFLEGKLQRYLKSEEVPHYEEGQILRKIVGRNFGDEVLRQPVNYLVLFCDFLHSKVCNVTKNMFEEVAKSIPPSKASVFRIGLIEVRKNEIENLLIEAVPEIKLYRIGRKATPAPLKNDISLDRIYQFLDVYLKELKLFEAEENKKEEQILSLG